jgi:hypothetical protein
MTGDHYEGRRAGKLANWEPRTKLTTDFIMRVVSTARAYTGTLTLSTISRINCSACSDFFRVEE